MLNAFANAKKQGLGRKELRKKRQPRKKRHTQLCKFGSLDDCKHQTIKELSTLGKGIYKVCFFSPRVTT